MIDKEKETEIVRLFHAEKWPVGTIATQLRVHHATVRQVVRPENPSPTTGQDGRDVPDMPNHAANRS